MMMIMFIAGKETENVNINHISQEKELRGGDNDIVEP